MHIDEIKLTYFLNSYTRIKIETYVEDKRIKYFLKSEISTAENHFLLEKIAVLCLDEKEIATKLNDCVSLDFWYVFMFKAEFT